MRTPALVLSLVVVLSACPPAPTPTPESTPVRMVVEQRDPLRVAIGETLTFTVKVTTPSGGARPKYVFGPGLSDPDLAFSWSVSKTGSGTETVTVTGQNYANPYLWLTLNVCPEKPYPNQDVECEWLNLPVTVYGGAPAKLTLPRGTASMVVGERRRLDGWVMSVPRATPHYPTVESRSHVPPTWTSAQPAVANVTADGAIEALSAGTATLTATVGGVSETLALTVAAGAPGPTPDTREELFATESQFKPKVAAFDDRSYAFVAGQLTNEHGDAFIYPWLAEWTGSGWGLSFITPPSHPGTVEALYVENGRVIVIVRTAYGVELLHRDAANPHAAWATVPLDRLSGLHAEFDPSVLQDRFALMYLEGEALFTGLDALEQDGGLFIAAGSYETNTRNPWPFQCVENVRLFEFKGGALTHRDVMTQSHHIGLGNPMPTQNDSCTGPIAPGHSLGLLQRLPGEPFPRVVYEAAPDAVLSSTTPTLIPTLDGERYGGPEGAHEFIPRTGRWAHRPLLPDGGIDVGQGRTADRLLAAGVLRGTPDDPQGVIVDVADPFLGGSARMTRVMLRTADGKWEPTPAEPPAEYMDPLISFGHVPYGAAPSRWGRLVAFDRGAFLVGTYAPRQPLFTESIDRATGQRLGDTTETDALIAEPLFTASGKTLLVTRRFNATAIYATGPTDTRFTRSTSNAMFLPRLSFTIGESLFFYDGAQLARSDDLGVTTQVVRTFSDTIRPKQIAVHPGGAAFIQDVAASVFERRFSTNLATAPISQVPPPSAGLLAGTLVIDALDETETAARVLGSEFIVLTRVSILRGGTIVKKLLVEHFDLTGARTSETLLDFSFPNLTQQLMFPGGVLLSATSFATLGYVPGESQVIVFDLATGATHTTSRPVQRVGTVFNQFTGYDRLLRTPSGKLLWALDEIPQGTGYRASSDDGQTFGPLQLLLDAAPTMTSWALHPTTGQLVTVLSTPYGPDYPDVASVRVFPAP